VGYEIVLTPSAWRDLEKIRAYIARDNSVAAQRFVLKLIDATETLSTFPQRGAVLIGRPGVRFILEHQYLIVYRIEEQTCTVRVLRFWHGARERKWMRL